jgi:hypothetical protein
MDFPHKKRAKRPFLKFWFLLAQKVMSYDALCAVMI